MELTNNNPMNEPEQSLPLDIINNLPTELLKEAPRLIEKYFNDSHQQKLAQIEFQKLQLQIQKEQLEYQSKVSEQQHILSIQSMEVNKVISEQNHRSRWQTLIFKSVVYLSTLAVFTLLAIYDKVNDVLSTVFGFAAMSIFSSEGSNLIKQIQNRISNTNDDVR